MGDEVLVMGVVPEFHRRVEEALGEPIEVLLFGSHARGEAREEFDVDVLLIVRDRDARTEDRIGDLAWEVGSKAGVVLSAIAVAREELRALEESPFIQAVRRQGWLHRAFDLRQLADYRELADIRQERVDEALRWAEVFVERVSAFPEAQMKGKGDAC